MWTAALPCVDVPHTSLKVEENRRPMAHRGWAGAALSTPVVLLGGHVTAEAPVWSRQSAPRGELLAVRQN